MTPLQLAATSLLITSLAFSTAPPPPEDLSQAGVQAAFEVLLQEYIHKDDLTYERLNRAALDGLLRELKTGAELVNQTALSTETPEPQVHHQMVSTTVAWLRPHALTPEEIPTLATAIADLQSKGATDLILDLRSRTSPGDFDTAAAILDLFLPAGEMLFRLRQFGGQEEEVRLTLHPAAWDGPLLALIDNESSSVAESVAAVLQHKKRALLIGTPTRGATVSYRTVPVDETWLLRYASAELLIDGTLSLFQKGLQPDLSVSQSGDEKAQSNRLIRQNRVRELVHETARPRYNEAALVAGSNPELETYLRRSLGKSSPEDKAVPRDRVLQRAVDLLHSRDHLQSSTLHWPLPAGSKQP